MKRGQTNMLRGLALAAGACAIALCCATAVGAQEEPQQETVGSLPDYLIGIGDRLTVSVRRTRI